MPAHPKYNLFKHGPTVCAAEVIRVINRNKGLYNVYVAPDGGMRVICSSSSKQAQRPVSERVGSYRRRLLCEPASNAPTAESVSEDLLKHLADA